MSGRLLGVLAGWWRWLSAWWTARRYADLLAAEVGAYLQWAAETVEP